MVLAREVEAKNFVLNIGHLGRRELVVQPATSEERGLGVKRIFSVLAIVALMAAMLAVSASWLLLLLVRLPVLGRRERARPLSTVNRYSESI
jgi:hypothetical protein